MKRLVLCLLAGSVLLASPAAWAQGKLFDSIRGAIGGSSSGAGAQQSEIASGLREALRVGTERAVNGVGRTDGFNADPIIHIMLPEDLRTAQSLLKKVGLSSLADDLELKLNRAAEAAAPEAKRIFWNAVDAMSLDDAMAIYKGPDDAATQYFRKAMSPDLKTAMKPVVEKGLQDAGAVQAYDSLIGEYRKMPFVPDLKADLTDHTLNYALDGIFHYLAEEEAAIRNNPVQRTTDLLRRVFGGG